MTTLAAIERQKAELLASIEHWPVNRLVFRPSHEAWCAIEVLDHLVKVESEVIKAARRGLLNPHSIGVRDRLGFLFLDRVFRSRTRVKVPRSATRVLPDLTCTLDTLRERWLGTRTDLARLLAQVEPAELELGVFRHPVSGWMSVPQILRFFSAHIQHHGYQLARIRATSEGTFQSLSGVA